MSRPQVIVRPATSQVDDLLSEVNKRVVLRVSADSRVAQVKVGVGRRVGDRIEITGGLEPGARVVAAGGGFLADGDTVRVVETAPIKPVALAPSAAQ